MTTPNNNAHEKKAISPPTPAAERKLSDILSDTRATFSSEHGKRELELLKSSARHGSPCFIFSAGSPTDPIAAAFINGRQSIILEILERLETPEDIPEAKPPKAKR